MKRREKNLGGAEGQGKVLRPDKASANLAGGEGESEAPTSMYDLDVTCSPSTIQLPLVITPLGQQKQCHALTKGHRYGFLLS